MKIKDGVRIRNRVHGWMHPGLKWFFAQTHGYFYKLLHEDN